MGISIAITLSVIIIPAEAETSKGNPATEVNSQLVCGDSLCSTPMSTSEKLEMFLAKSENQPEEVFVLQQSMSQFNSQLASEQFTIKKQILTANSNLVSDKTKLLQISKLIKSKNFDSFDSAKIKSSMSKFDNKKISKLSDMRKSFDFINLKSKIGKNFDNIPLITPGKLDRFNLGDKINFDSSKLKLLVNDFGKNRIDPLDSKPVDSKNSEYAKMIENLKEKKLKIEKSK